MARSSSKSRTRAQARKDRARLKKLRDSGLYAGKVDLRKAPTKYQKTLFAKFADRLSRRTRAKTTKRAPKRSAKKPAPKVVPRKRQPPRLKKPRVSSRKKISRKQIDKLSRTRGYKLKTYALPFKRRKGTTEWRRFTYEQLKAFLAEYVQNAGDAREWREYAIEETWTFDDKSERDERREELDENYPMGEDISVREIKPVHDAVETEKKLPQWKRDALDAGLME